MAAMRRSTERTLSRYSSSLCWSGGGQCSPQVPGAAEHEVQQASIQSTHRRRFAPAATACCSCLLKRRLSTLRGLISAGTACVGERKLQCE